MNLKTQFLVTYMITFFCSMMLAVTSFVLLLQPSTAHITPDVSGFFTLVFVCSTAAMLASFGMMLLHDKITNGEK